MTEKDMAKIKQYLKYYFDITIKKWSPNIYASTNWRFFKKYDVTLEEMLENYRLADALDNELQQPVPDVQQNGGTIFYQNKYNKKLYLVIDEFST